MKKLTNNVGDKIKRASIILFILSLIWSCLESFLYFEKSYLKITNTGEVVMNGSRPDFFGGIVVLLVGILISFVVFFLMYGFGDIVENIAVIRNFICKDDAVKVKVKKIKEDCGDEDAVDKEKELKVNESTTITDLNEE